MEDGRSDEAIFAEKIAGESRRGPTRVMTHPDA
jgi:hypothetical protein